MKAKRNGVALIAALVVMGLIAIVLTVVTVQVVAQRKVLRQRELQLQADWLARAGVELAAARLLESPKEFSDKKNELVPGGKVKIEVTKSADDVFVVKTEAEVALPDEKPVFRSAAARFRRIEKDGVVRLQTLRGR